MRKKLPSSTTFTCPYCKTEKLSVKIDNYKGFITTKLCTNPECRFRMSMEIMDVREDGKFSVTFRPLGIQMIDRIPWKGCMSAQKSKISGALVMLYRISEMGVPLSKEYLTVCVKHDTGNFCNFDDFTEVMKFQSKPHLWCEGCKKEHGRQ